MATVQVAGVMCPSILALAITMVAEVPEALVGIPVLGELEEIPFVAGKLALVEAAEVALAVGP